MRSVKSNKEHDHITANDVVPTSGTRIRVAPEKRLEGEAEVAAAMVDALHDILRSERTA